tara:strand:- start:143 stop:841 length:699 start_codon:yes stop_codon:yes gene_type:complete
VIAGIFPETSLGIIGGFGPDTSTKFQLSIIHQFQKKFNRQPKVVMVNAPVTKQAEKLAIKGDPRLLREFLVDSVKTLCSANVSVIVLPCNTAHVFISDLRKESKVPVISIIEKVAEFISKRFSKVGLLATSSTINFGLFQKEFSKANIQLILPFPDQQKDVDKIIQKLLDCGKSNKQIDCDTNTITKSLRNRGTEVILLACTDLQFINFGATNIPIIDSLQVLKDVSLGILK